MSREQRCYLSYLIRLWQISSEGELVWRASLESPHTGERKGFASLDGLLDFLREQTGGASDANAEEGKRGGDDLTTEQID